MLNKRLGELKIGDKLYVTMTKTSITLLEIKGNRMYFSNNIGVKIKEELQLVYYTEHAIYCWKIKPIKIKQDLIVFKANELNTSRINKRQAPRVDLSDENVEVLIYKCCKDKLKINETVIKNDKTDSLESTAGDFIGTGQIINVSELGLRFKCNCNLTLHEVYVLKFKLDIEREIVSKVLYTTKEGFYGVEFQPRVIQLEFYIKNAQIEKIKKRRLKE